MGTPVAKNISWTAVPQRERYDVIIDTSCSKTVFVIIIIVLFVFILDEVILFKQGTPTDNELLSVAQDTISVWEKLGLALDLTNSHLDEVDADHSNVLDKSYAMLRKWKESHGVEATFERLAKGLKHKAVNRRDLIDEYCRDQGN